MISKVYFRLNFYSIASENHTDKTEYVGIDKCSFYLVQRDGNFLHFKMTFTIVAL